jgi:D-3-phosphoglycerate dehydrogenase / 2-oxoglutarate reductase
MFRVRTLNRIAAAGTNLLDKTRYAVGDQMDDPDALLVRSANLHELPLNPALRAIARAGAGVDNIPVDRCTKNGVVVFNTPGANANAVKELTIAVMLLAARKVVEGVAWTRQLPPEADVAKEVERGKSAFGGPELAGKTLGVFGLGAVGALVANAATDLGMVVYGYDPYITIDNAWLIHPSVRRAASPQTLFSQCDYISLHVPVTPETKGLIDQPALAAMKDGVRVINMARGELVNTADMAVALASCKVACYVTDFPSNEIMALPNGIAIPHLGASTPESEENCAVMAVRELMDYLETGNIKNSVNFPDIQNPGGGDESICIIHENKPGMLAGLSAVLSQAGLNIENLTNRSKKDIACSIIAISGTCTPETAARLAAEPGTIRVHRIQNRR